MARWLMRLFVCLGALGSVAALLIMFLFPPARMRVNRDGVAHFTPPVAHPYTGETLRVEALVEHYKGGRR